MKSIFNLHSDFKRSPIVYKV